jgi:hypothetical protein
MHTLPRECSKAVGPSSRAMRTRSRLSSSISRARSGPYSSTVTTCEEDKALHQSTSKSRCHDKEANPAKRRRKVKTHLADDDAQLEKEASVPTRRDDGWRWSRWGLPLQERSPCSPPLAITGDKTWQALRPVAGKGNFSVPARRRSKEQFDTYLFIRKLFREGD